MDRVAADSTFYIFFYADIKDKDSLYYILKNYDMYVGERIKEELNRHIHKDAIFNELIIDTNTDVDFSELLRVFYNFLTSEYPQIQGKIKDGEYEAIGIAYLLKEIKTLKYLIIDDKYAYNFIIKNLDSIKENLVRTIRFLYLSHIKDSILEKELVIDILMALKKEIDEGKTPLYITKDMWERDVKPLVDKLKGE